MRDMVFVRCYLVIQTSLLCPEQPGSVLRTEFAFVRTGSLRRVAGNLQEKRGAQKAFGRDLENQYKIIPFTF